MPYAVEESKIRRAIIPLGGNKSEQLPYLAEELQVRIVVMLGLSIRSQNSWHSGKGVRSCTIFHTLWTNQKSVARRSKKKQTNKQKKTESNKSVKR